MSSAVSLPHHKCFLFLDRLSCKSLTSTCAHSFARNWQLPFLNQRKGENDPRKYFMINLHGRMLPDPAGIEPTTPDHQSDTQPTEPPRPADGCQYIALHAYDYTYTCTSVHILFPCDDFIRIPLILLKLTSHVMEKDPLSHMQTAKVQACLRIRAVSPDTMLFAHVSGRTRGNFS